jgi:hypothetical protein
VILAGGSICGGVLAFGTVTIDDHAVGNSVIDPLDATCSISYQSGRNVVDHTAAVLETWADAGLGANYEIRATKTGGVDPTSGPALSTWHNLGTTRTWELFRGSLGANNCYLTIEIREAGTSTILDSAAITSGSGDTPPYRGGGGENEE